MVLPSVKPEALINTNVRVVPVVVMKRDVLMVGRQYIVVMTAVPRQFALPETLVSRRHKRQYQLHQIGIVEGVASDKLKIPSFMAVFS